MGFATAAAIGSMAVSGIQAVQGIRAANDAADSADAAMAMQQQTFDRMDQLGDENLQWFRERFSEWEQEYAPVLDELKSEAMAGVTPDYAAIATDTRKAFERARENHERQLGAFGIKPGDGQYGANERRFAISEAATEVGAREQARRDADRERFSKLASVYGIGSAEKRTALSGVSSAAGQYQSALSGVAGGQGQRAQMYGQAAAAANNAAWGQDWDGVIDNALNAFGDFGSNESPSTGGGYNPAGYETGGNWRPPGYVGPGDG